jgi:hypothetical protein
MLRIKPRLPTLTVSFPARWRIRSFGVAQSLSLPVTCMPVQSINVPKDDLREERTNYLGSLEFPRRSGHSVNCISTTNTNCQHPKATCVWRMRVYRLRIQCGPIQWQVPNHRYQAWKRDGGERKRLTIARAISHEHSRGGIILEDDLVDDSRARSPEFNPVLFGCAL